GGGGARGGGRVARRLAPDDELILQPRGMYDDHGRSRSSEIGRRSPEQSRARNTRVAHAPGASDGLSPLSPGGCPLAARRVAGTAPTEWHTTPRRGRPGKRAGADPVDNMNPLGVDFHLLDQRTNDPATHLLVAGVNPPAPLRGQFLDPTDHQPQLLPLLLGIAERLPLRLPVRQSTSAHIHISLKLIFLHVAFSVHLHQPRNPPLRLRDQLVQTL